MKALFLTCFVGLGAVLFGEPQAIKVDVRLVNIITTVSDSKGRYVGGLNKDEFVLEVDGVRQEIAHFSFDQDTPVSMGILFDTSGSMENKMRAATLAVDRFIRTIHADDDIFLMTFSDVSSLRQDFTNDRDVLSKALIQTPAAGTTALYAAIIDGLEKIKSGRHKKRAILLLTDGADSSSSSLYNSALRSIRESELLVYPLGIRATTPDLGASDNDREVGVPGFTGLSDRASRSRDHLNMSVLQNFANQSGGRAFVVTDTSTPQAMEKIFTQIADELRTQYSLAFYPTHPDDGKFHRIKVRTRPGLTARARPGYTALAK